MAPKTVQKTLREYKETVKKNIPLEEMLVFGSAAAGRMSPNSDLDVIVVSDHFKEMDVMRRLALLSGLRSGRARRVPMDILGFTRQEFKSFKKEKSAYIRDIVGGMKKV